MGPNMRHGQDTGGDRQRQRGVVDAQTRLRTHLAVTRVLAEAQSLPEAAPQVLEAICRRLGWELGALWMVDRRAQVLRCVDLWHVPATSLLGFTLATRHAVFREGEGLPGRVWAEPQRPLGARRRRPPGHAAHGAPRRRECWERGSALPDPERPPMGSARSSSSAPSGARRTPSCSAPWPPARQPDRAAPRAAPGGGRRARQAGRASQRAIVEAALDCIVTVDERGRVLEFNPAAVQTFAGYRADQAIGMPVTDLLIPERLRGEHAAAFERYLQGGEPHSPGQALRVVPACAPTGRSSRWSWPIARVDLPGPPVFTGYLRDLTDSRLAERIARDLAAIVESTEDAILVEDARRRDPEPGTGAPSASTATPPTRRSASRCRR